MRGFIDTHLCIGIAMKLPDGVVRMIYRKVEEQWLIEHKERFSESLDMLGGMCEMYQVSYQDEYDDLIEYYADESDDEDDLAVDIGNLPSFVQYCRNWFWYDNQLYHH